MRILTMAAAMLLVGLLIAAAAFATSGPAFQDRDSGLVGFWSSTEEEKHDTGYYRESYAMEFLDNGTFVMLFAFEEKDGEYVESSDGWIEEGAGIWSTSNGSLTLDMDGEVLTWSYVLTEGSESGKSLQITDEEGEAYIFTPGSR